MDKFKCIKEHVTARDIADFYGIKINRSGMACCPFHNDRRPSMKVDERFYCFGCGATGDAIDLAEKILGLPPYLPSSKENQAMVSRSHSHSTALS